MHNFINKINKPGLPSKNMINILQQVAKSPTVAPNANTAQNSV